MPGTRRHSLRAPDQAKRSTENKNRQQGFSTKKMPLTKRTGKGKNPGLTFLVWRHQSKLNFCLTLIHALSFLFFLFFCFLMDETMFIFFLGFSCFLVFLGGVLLVPFPFVFSISFTPFFSRFSFWDLFRCFFLSFFFLLLSLFLCWKANLTMCLTSSHA